MFGLILFIMYTAKCVKVVSLQNTIYRETIPPPPPLFTSVYIPPKAQRLAKTQIEVDLEENRRDRIFGTTQTHTWSDMAKTNIKTCPD